MASVVLENVRVDFPIYATERNLRSALGRATGGLIQREGKKHERVVVRALTGVSMTLRDGDRLGLIGHNGSGKSTLLKVIAGIYEPIEGRVIVEGRVTPLFDMMPGLDIEGSGYENIVTAGLLLGLSRDEIESKIPDVEEFCELGEYLSLPVRTYSTGMQMRLGFALVTALDPGVLLMDEGIGAGDARFAGRAQRRLDEFVGRSRIIVVASHSTALIRSICNKAALLQSGRIVALGSVGDVFEQYDAILRGASSTAASPIPISVAEVRQDDDRSGVVDGRAAASIPKDLPKRAVYSEQCIRNLALDDRLNRTSGAARFTKAIAQDDNGAMRWDYASGESVRFCFDYEVLEPVTDLVIVFRLVRAQENLIDIRDVVSSRPVEAGRSGSIEVTLFDLRPVPGKLFLCAWLQRADNSHAYDVIDFNIDFPELVIGSVGGQAPHLGPPSSEYKIRKTERVIIEGPAGVS